jgi:hypothetical protein
MKPGTSENLLVPIENCLIRWVHSKLRFKLGSIKGSKKSGFGPYATPPKRLRIFEFLVRDQEDGGSNPLAPTNYFYNQSSTGMQLVVECLVAHQEVGHTLFGLGTQMFHFHSSQPRRRVAFIDPMECLAVRRLPDGAERVYEIKLDGVSGCRDQMQTAN